MHLLFIFYTRMWIQVGIGAQYYPVIGIYAYLPITITYLYIPNTRAHDGVADAI